MAVPDQPKIYHIVHADRLASIVGDGFLWADSVMAQRPDAGTMIGMSRIKTRRLTELRLNSHPQLLVGQCVPFYFCPRSVMLFLIHKRHEELTYKGGQNEIVHLEADLHQAVAWANAQRRRWAFTLSNAAGYYAESRADLSMLDEIDWPAVQARQWSSPSVKEGKQAEFLVENSFPWHLVRIVGVQNRAIVPKVTQAFAGSDHRPQCQVRPEWYY
jgi:hypothetical protein